MPRSPPQGNQIVAAVAAAPAATGQKMASLVKARQFRGIRFQEADAIAVRANLHFF
jgi:hypothetical protein